MSTKDNNGNSVSYYDVLMVNSASSDSDIRKAYYKLAKRFHPDANPQERRLSELRFRLINEAYAQLKTKENRMRYNRILKQNKTRKMPKAGNDNMNPNKKGFFEIFGELFGFSKNGQSENVQRWAIKKIFIKFWA